MRVTLSLLCAVVSACTTTAVSDRPLSWSDPAAVGMSAQRLEQIPHAMQRYVDEGSVSGIVTMAARHGRLVHWDAVGGTSRARWPSIETTFFGSARCPSP